MRTVIIGAGAMGCLIGALLAESGVEVILYDLAVEQVAAIMKQGLMIERENSRRTVKVQATTDLTDLKEVGQIDLVVVLVKAYDTISAIEGIRSCISPETQVLTLQNGDGNIDAITSIIPSHRVFAGVTSHGAMLLEPGIIRHNGGGKTFIGAVDPGEFSKAEEIASFFQRAGLETVISHDIQGIIWTKLIVNAAINPLTALMGCTNGQLLGDKDLLGVMKNIVDEGEKVALAAGIKLIQSDMFGYVKSVCLATKDNKSSMLMDVLKGRRTEIDAINGMVVSLGEINDLEAPVNKCLTRLVRSFSQRES